MASNRSKNARSDSLVNSFIASQPKGISSCNNDQHRHIHAGYINAVRWSRRLPVGRNLPVTAPTTSMNCKSILAAVPGTPSIAVSPSYCTLPPGVCTRATTNAPVLTSRILYTGHRITNWHQTHFNGGRPYAGQYVATSRFEVTIFSVTPLGQRNNRYPHLGHLTVITSRPCW